MIFSAMTLLVSGLDLGANAPVMKGKNQEGKEVELKAADGHEWLLIFTYPKALTGG